MQQARFQGKLIHTLLARRNHSHYSIDARCVNVETSSDLRRIMLLIKKLALHFLWLSGNKEIFCWLKNNFRTQKCTPNCFQSIKIAIQLHNRMKNWKNSTKSTLEIHLLFFSQHLLASALICKNHLWVREAAGAPR